MNHLYKEGAQQIIKSLELDLSDEGDSCSSTCSACGGSTMIPGVLPGDDVMNTPCPGCNENHDPERPIPCPRSVGGKFAKFKKGEMVKVRCYAEGMALVTRATWKGSNVALCNSMGISLHDLFNEPNAEVCQPSDEKRS